MCVRYQRLRPTVHPRLRDESWPRGQNSHCSFVINEWLSDRVTLCGRCDLRNGGGTEVEAGCSVHVGRGRCFSPWGSFHMKMQSGIFLYDATRAHVLSPNTECTAQGRGRGFKRGLMRQKYRFYTRQINYPDILWTACAHALYQPNSETWDKHLQRTSRALPDVSDIWGWGRGLKAAFPLVWAF